MMVCIYCANEMKVTNSRLLHKSNAIWRRRQCDSCRAVFTTHEQIDLSRSLVIKTSNAYEPFLRDKLWLSIYDSLKHRKTATHDATELTTTIISKLFDLIENAQIDSLFIAGVAYSVLKRFDKAAAVHYQAYYPAD